VAVQEKIDMNGPTKHHILIAVIAFAPTACLGDELDIGMAGAAVAESGEDDASGTSAALGAAVYLGSGIPASSSMVGHGVYQVDSNWYGAGFNIGGVHYTKGIYAHAPSQVIFPLNNAYTKLTGCVGLDDADGNCGDGSQVSVYAGDALLWTSYVGHQSVVCMPPLNVSGVVLLRLGADALGTKNCDEVEWVNMLVR
jgi:hypothetical protein